MKGVRTKKREGGGAQERRSLVSYSWAVVGWRETLILTGFLKIECIAAFVLDAELHCVWGRKDKRND